MPLWTGSFNKSGSPTIKVTIAGPLPGSGQEFEAIVDTGFTGFVSMPIVQAFPLGLILAGTTSVLLADGSTVPKLMAYGMATVEGEKKAGVILLAAGSSEILVGMEFLKTFGKVLLIHQGKQIAALADEKDVDVLFAAAAAALEQQKQELEKQLQQETVAQPAVKPTQAPPQPPNTPDPNDPNQQP
jgi:predicted aspartyl protease